ncbi:YdcF family protein [uncultured Cohaesibacter sp.]|uniref:YdcF family protein n=1 Tax=uncultured Cohaesibacter sp. TaxID=1002546 RepID=UPI002AAA8A45|nr:YdcF family protein [uncultured Cohaesibacter sp.]
MPQSLAQQSSALRKGLYALLFAASIGLCALLIGWAIFIAYALTADETPPEPADAIVVVTGGAGRLERAIELLKEGKGHKLLISGVHYRNSDHTLFARFDLDKEMINCCVDLDREALNTVANATQTAIWAKENNFKSLIIVTSAYHMPRTLLEMRRAAPDVSFQSDLVAGPTKQPLLSRLINWNTVHLLTKEYFKLLAAVLHGTTERLLSHRGQ